MGVSDGSVIGLTKLVDSGSPADKWNLVLVAEGYRPADQATFQARAQDLIDHILATPPWSEDAIACAINIYRLDVESDEAGADRPGCPDLPAGASVDTYFDATFCSDGEIQRLVSGDSALVVDTVEALLPQWHQIIVIVNDAERGGAGGQVAWTTTGGDWLDVSLHEMGHSAFGLADEYCCYTCEDGETGHDNYTGGEPSEPNVSTEGDPAAVKWSALVTASTAAVTMPNPDCTQRNLGPSPVAAGVVGTFEGAQYFHCGLFRPEYNCMMRETGQPFCAVCRQAIRDLYAPFAGPAPAGGVTLETPTVVFNDVPELTTTVRAARFAVDSCVSVTFQVTTSPGAPFALESPAVVVASPAGPPPWPAYVWFRFTCDAGISTHADAATITCLETGDVFNVSLTANCVPRPRVAVQLVFDQSGSMLDITDEGRRKEQVLRDAATVFVDLLYDDNGVGINTYDDDAHPSMDIEEALAPGGGGGRDTAYIRVDAYAANPDGLTAIGDGVELAKSKLDAATAFDVRAMVVLTDGIETASKYIADVTDTVINEKVFAIGLGEPSQIRPAALNALADGTGGYLLMTGNLSADDTFLLTKYYLQILAGVNNNDIVLDPEGWVLPGHDVRIPFDVAESDIEITGIVLALATFALDFALETPGGQVVDEAFAAGNPSVKFRRADQTIHIRAMLPVLVGAQAAHEGRWHLLIRTDKGRFAKYLSWIRDSKKGYEQALAHGVRYSANVHVYSNLRLVCRVSQSSLEPGATLTPRAFLTEYGVPFGGSANVVADLTHPDGLNHILALSKTSPGVFEAPRVAADAGLYRFRVRARGRTRRDMPFTREQTVTAGLWRGGDTPPPGPNGKGLDLCDVLRCVFDAGVLGAELRKKLHGAGIDIDRLERCLREKCGEARGARQPSAEIVRLVDALAQLVRSR